MNPEIPMTEAQLLACVKSTALDFGWLVYHTLHSKGSDSGFPDLVMLRHGILLFVELKSTRGKLTKGKYKADRRGRMIYHPGQEDWLDALAMVGERVRSYCWRPEHWHNGTIERELR
jgi:hypothetical protein